jgi:hypothetical protein
MATVITIVNYDHKTIIRTQEFEICDRNKTKNANNQSKTKLNQIGQKFSLTIEFLLLKKGKF